MPKAKLIGYTTLAALLLGSASMPGATAQPPAPAPGVPAEDSVYSTTHGPEAMTVYRPEGRDESGQPRAGLIFVHGGAWVRGDRSLLDNAAHTAAQRGFVVFDIDYDLSVPRDPREYQDVEAAITHIRTHAADYGVDPDRLGGLGTSAGAHLLMQAVITDGAPLAAVVGWSGPYDLTDSATPRASLMSAVAAITYLGCVPGTADCTQRARAASPALHTSAGNPPVMLFNSSDELMPVDQMTEFAARLRAAGTPVDTRVVPGKRHAVAYSDEALGPTLDFLSDQLQVSDNGQGTSGH